MLDEQAEDDCEEVGEEWLNDVFARAMHRDDEDDERDKGDGANEDALEIEGDDDEDDEQDDGDKFEA